MLFYSATIAAVVAFILSAIPLVTCRTSTLVYAQWGVRLALVLLTLHGVGRWMESGHVPLVTRYESLVLLVWFLLCAYLVVHRFIERSLLVLAPVSLASSLILGWASTASHQISLPTAALDSGWLYVHASFAASSKAILIMAAALSVVFLLGRGRMSRRESFSGILPDSQALPNHVTNMVLLGLTLWSIMVISGSMWAHGAWGRYWAWDPIEIWSLISWLIFGAILHFRIGLKISAPVFCWLVIIGGLFVVLLLWGVHMLYDTMHTYG